MQPVSDGGGSEHALIRMGRRLRTAGWDLHVALPGPPVLASEYAAAGVTCHIVPMERLTTSGGATRWAAFAARWPGSVLALARLARRLDVDVVHTNSLHSWYGWAAAVLARRPHVWHAREVVFQSGAALRLERALCARFADRVIAVSGTVAGQLEPRNVSVVLDGADPDRFGPARAGRFRAGAGIGDGTPLVGSVARIDTWKGFGVLLDAWPTVRAARPDLELVVAGGAVPGKEAYAEDLARRAATLPGVHWLGQRRDVGDVMADLDLFVQVSTEPEPFGLVVVEALASGVPVVAGAAGGPLEILGSEPSPCGRVVPPGDAAALAGAVLATIDAPPTSTEQRRARSPLRGEGPDAFVGLFEAVTRPGGGTGRRDRRRWR